MSAVKYVILGLVFFAAVAGVWISVLEYTVDDQGVHGWHMKK